MVKSIICTAIYKCTFHIFRVLLHDPTYGYYVHEFMWAHITGQSTHQRPNLLQLLCCASIKTSTTSTRLQSPFSIQHCLEQSKHKNTRADILHTHIYTHKYTYVRTYDAIYKYVYTHRCIRRKCSDSYILEAYVMSWIASVSMTKAYAEQTCRKQIRIPCMQYTVLHFASSEQ
jgi:hypothetical protein